MGVYRTASFFRVATYLRLNGEKRPLGFFYVRNINPIKEDLVDLQIAPTTEGRGFLIHVEDHDCSRLPNEVRYMDMFSARGLCQFIVDHSDKTVYIKEDEQPIWQGLFDKINYEIDFTSGKLRLKGMNGFDLTL